MLRLAIRQNHLRATTVAAVRCGLKASAARTYFSGGSSAKPQRQRPSFGTPPVYSCWLATGSPLAAEIIANVYDAVVIDGQHGIGDTAAMLTALSAAPTPPIAIVRVSKLCDGEIAKALDAGAHALICPMINSVKEADAFVKAAMYPPHGHRSFGPHRAILPHIAAPTGSLGDWVRNENANIKTFAMIETRGGLDDLEAILQVPGLTGVFIGPNDLSLCLGAEPSSAPEGEVLQTIERIVNTAHKYGLQAGIFCGEPQTAKRMAALGFDLINVGSDMGFIAGGAAASLAEARRVE